MKIGSLFSGYGGLEMGVQSVLGGTVAWHSEIDPGACKILAHRYPDVPNLGDITAIDWAAVEPVDVITGGTPCQDLSHAGKRLGMRAGTRSGLWASMCDAIDIIRPSLVVWENVRGALSAGADSSVEPCPICVGDERDSHLRALGRVVGDLAELGYVGRWTGLRAADVGAPHGRFRVFVAAWPATDSDDAGRSERGRPVAVAPELATTERRSDAAPHTHGDALREQPVTVSRGSGSPVAGLTSTHAFAVPASRNLRRRYAPAWGSAPHSTRDGWHEGWAESARVVGGSDAAVGGHGSPADAISGGRAGRAHDPFGGAVDGALASRPGPGASDWGVYEPAIRRWERLTRPAPPIAEQGSRGGWRLSPRFSEWMMGLPVGWVTDVPGLSRNEQLKALGNGVVSQQAAHALRLLLPDVQAVAA